MSWVLLSILSAFSYAIVSILDKYLITKIIKKPIALATIMSVIGLLVSALVYFIHGFSSLSKSHIFLALLAGALYTLAVLLFFEALKTEEASRVVPILFLNPVFTAILSSFFLNEVFPPVKYFGVFLLVIGAILISIKNYKVKLGKSFWIILAIAPIISIYTIITKYVLGFADFWTVFSYGRIAEFIILVPIFYAYSKDFKLIFKNFNPRSFSLILSNELMSLFGILFFIAAASRGPATFVNALTSIEPFFVLFFIVILSIWYPRFLKEEIGKSTVLLKFVAIVIMFIGTIIVAG